MIKAVFLDLDNTLLHNPDHVFSQEFLRLADAHFQEHLQLNNISQIFRQMMYALKHERDLQSSIWDLLCQLTSEVSGHSIETINRVMSAFYKDKFPSLKHCVQAIPQASELVQSILSKDLGLIIATNPLYPQSAILERMKWAGLPTEPQLYMYISNSQNMHFIKPNPAYYAEILGRVGIEPDEAIMVGDSVDNDILPAIEVGMNSFLITNSSEQHDVESMKGSLLDFQTLIENQTRLEQLPPILKSPNMIEPQLIGNIAALYGMVEGIPNHYWNQHPDPNEWSPIQVLCHLAESEETVQRPRLKQITFENNPFLTTPKTPPGPSQYECREDSEVYIDRFVKSRKVTISFLRTLDIDDWYHPARHSIFGPTNLLEMAYFTAQHDRLHLKQLCRTLGKCT